MECSFCGRSGHTRSHCWKLHKRCFLCGQDGHFREFCPEKQVVTEKTGDGGYCFNCRGTHYGKTCDSKSPVSTSKTFTKDFADSRSSESLN